MTIITLDKYDDVSTTTAQTQNIKPSNTVINNPIFTCLPSKQTTYCVLLPPIQVSKQRKRHNTRVHHDLIKIEEEDEYGEYGQSGSVGGGGGGASTGVVLDSASGSVNGAFEVHKCEPEDDIQNMTQAISTAEISKKQV